MTQVPEQKLRKIQIMLRLINYELENGYVGNNREYKSSTNIRGVLDGATKVQLFSYLKSKGESIDDFPFSFTVAGWKLEKKMKNSIAWLKDRMVIKEMKKEKLD